MTYSQVTSSIVKGAKGTKPQNNNEMCYPVKAEEFPPYVTWFWLRSYGITLSVQRIH